MFPVAVLFIGMLLTVLIGLHVVIHSVGRTAAESAADLGVNAAQGELPAVQPCQEPFPDLLRVAEYDDARECAGARAAGEAMRAADSMVVHVRPPAVIVDDVSGVVTVVTFGKVRSPLCGFLGVDSLCNVDSRACAPLEILSFGGPTQGNPGGCA